MYRERGMPVRLLTAIVVLLAAQSPVPAHASSSLPVLARITTIRGSRTGYVRVRIPSSARMDLRENVGRRAGPNSHIAVKGGGGFVGIALVPDPPREPALDRNFLVAGRFRDCGSPACGGRHRWNYVNSSAGTGWHGREDKSVRLSAGIYRLYLMTDHSPARVTLTFEGLEGRLTIGPERVSELDLKAPVSRASSPTLTSWGDRFAKDGAGLSLVNLWFHTPVNLGHDWGLCSFKGSTPPVSATVAFSPALCDNYWIASDAAGGRLGLPPAGGASSGGESPGPLRAGHPASFLVQESWWTNAWRTVTFGGWASAEGGIDSVAVTALFLSW